MVGQFQNWLAVCGNICKCLGGGGFVVFSGDGKSTLKLLESAKKIET